MNFTIAMMTKISEVNVMWYDYTDPIIIPKEIKITTPIGQRQKLMIIDDAITSDEVLQMITEMLEELK